jgi:hypothetical protein
MHRLVCHAASASRTDLAGLVLADRDGRARLLAATDRSGPTEELFALQGDQGPGLDVVDMEEAVVDVDLRAAVGIWPRFAPAALARGYRVAHGLPLRLGRDVVGAVVLLGCSVQPLGPEEMTGVQALADIATIALVQDVIPAPRHRLLDSLDAALGDRATVERARGVLAQRCGVPMAEALRLLEVEARESGARVVDAAAAVLRTLSADVTLAAPRDGGSGHPGAPGS